MTENPDFGAKFYLLMIWIHSLPAATTFINVYISKVVFIKSHYKYMLCQAFLYNIVNIIVVKIRGKALYYFLTWDNIESYLIAAAIIIVNLFAYLGICSFIRKMKLPSEKTKHR